MAKERPDWGSLLNEYYQMTRSALPGELEFWDEQISEHDTVIEIGSGQGFISKVLAEKQPKSLYLIEPCASSAAYLEPLARDYDFIETRYDLFEHCQELPEADVILFPYDSLPMVDKNCHDDFFRCLFNSLKTGGKFIFHVSTRSWIDQYLDAFKTTYRKIKKFPSGKQVNVIAWAERDSEDSYSKYFVFIDTETDHLEYYDMKTNILDHHRILALCEKHGFNIDSVLTSFNEKSSDDLIYTLVKT